MKNYLKKDGTLEKKAIEIITTLRSGKFVKLSNFYSSQTTKYPSVLNSDLFIIVSDKETIISEGFFPTTRAIVKINKENKYVEQTLKEIEEQDLSAERVWRKRIRRKELMDKGMSFEEAGLVVNNENNKRYYGTK